MSSATVGHWAVIPAAGRGRRFGAAQPKQYLRIDGRSILEISVSRLLAVAAIERVVVAVDRDDSDWQALPIMSDARVQTVHGGAERADSVRAALRALESVAQPDDWVLVHDAARPCVTVAAIENLMEQLREDAVGGLLAAPLSDTVKRADSESRVAATVDRNGLWAAQTPQMFRYRLLVDALDSVPPGVAVTDEASAMEAAGHRPLLVAGPATNLKITRPRDLALATLILRAEK